MNGFSVFSWFLAAAVCLLPTSTRAADRPETEDPAAQKYRRHIRLLEARLVLLYDYGLDFSSARANANNERGQDIKRRIPRLTRDVRDLVKVASEDFGAPYLLEIGRIGEISLPSHNLFEPYRCAAEALNAALDGNLAQVRERLSECQGQVEIITGKGGVTGIEVLANLLRVETQSFRVVTLEVSYDAKGTTRYQGPSLTLSSGQQRRVFSNVFDGSTHLLRLAAGVWRVNSAPKERLLRLVGVESSAVRLSCEEKLKEACISFEWQVERRGQPKPRTVPMP